MNQGFTLEDVLNNAAHLLPAMPSVADILQVPSLFCCQRHSAHSDVMAAMCPVTNFLAPAFLPSHECIQQMPARPAQHAVILSATDSLNLSNA